MYRENYGIHVNNIKLQNLFKQTDDRGVYLFLEKRLREKKEFLAAEAIQKIVKGWITRRWWYPIREKRRVASTRLQMYWRRYYRLYVVIPRQRIALKHELAPLIQACMRGYLSRLEAMKMRRDQRVASTLNYFRDM